MPETIYDVAIIGSGPAGYTAAIRAGQYGLKTVLIEKDGFLGGTCLHVGCIPTKALLFNAELWDHLKEAKEFGIEGVDARKLNWSAIQERKSKIVAKHAKGLEFLMKKNKVETVKGYGKLTGPAQNGIIIVEVANDGKSSQLKTKNVLLATGSEARMLPGLEADDRVLTNIEILSLKEIPKSLVIVGAGAVGVEFASIYQSFGCEVTIVEMLPRLVPVEDEEVSKELARVYRKRGISFHTAAKVDKVEKTKAGIAVTITVDGKQQKIEAEKILIAVGRKPRTENIGLEKTKIKPERGFIQTDSWMHTAEPGVYAVGDIVLGMPQLAHVGAMEALVAIAKIAGKPCKPINPEHIPGATYCHPEIGSVGLTETKAREAGYNIKVGKFPFTANSRASIVGQHEGFIKIISDADYGEILGVHIIGPQATELIAEAVAAMELEATVEDLMWTIHAHPTLAEAMLDASNSVYGMAINA
ncbi:MAG TPA: dihydrolipoyl dehydrogenase [Candidatus Deferrimicrobiaceae bacterium]|nr:dihydrolipoyl dehydrogenase [Candidatus Deferrimicrobiaceae bacterium]